MSVLVALREAREAKGWSQHKLSVEADVSSRCVCRIENGAQKAKPVTQRKLLTALGLTMEDAPRIFGGKSCEPQP